MKRGKNRDLLIKEIQLFIPYVMVNKKIIDEMSTHLYDNYSIPKGELLFVLNKSRRLEYKETEFLLVLAEQISVKIEQAQSTLNLKVWLTENEIKELRKYVYVDSTINNDEVEFPLVLSNVIYLGRGVYNASIDEELVARLYKHNNLNYNFDIQRDAVMVQRGDEYIKTINLNHKNIAEMKELIIKDKLMTTSLAYNCAVNTADGDLDELEYDDETQELTINKGTVIDIVDGTHRTIAFHSVYKDNHKLTGKIPVLITNYTTAKAKEYQAQLAKATPISKARQIALEEKDYTVTLINRLNSEGMLKDKISSTKSGVKANNIYRAYFTDLMAIFDLIWKPETKRDVSRIFDFFDKYLEYLDDYIHNNKTEDSYYLTDKRMIIAHISIAKYMYDNEISIDEFDALIEKIDWSQQNEEFKELRGKLINTTFSKRSIKDTNDCVLELIKK